MGLFSRRAKEVEEAPEPTRDVPAQGPFDVDDKPTLGNRVDLGALRVPKLRGMSLRLELERSTRVPVAATVGLADSTLQIQVFAAPKTMPLWEDILPELVKSIRSNGGEPEEVDGEFGRELRAAMPVTTPGGSGTRLVRFVGIDGPRWLVRGTFTGPAANGGAAAHDLEGLLRGVVVVRGSGARPPREVLPLTIPGQAAPESSEEPSGGDLPMPKRGPEMTETR